jgi:hypothetical protein
MLTKIPPNKQKNLLYHNFFIYVVYNTVFLDWRIYVTLRCIHIQIIINKFPVLNGHMFLKITNLECSYYYLWFILVIWNLPAKNVWRRELFSKFIFSNYFKVNYINQRVKKKLLEVHITNFNYKRNPRTFVVLQIKTCFQFMLN